jgi:cell fate regulator YaaT (PSP1 superfamily)
MRTLGVLSVRGKDKTFRRGQRVVARTKRGLEAGEVLCEAESDTVSRLRDPEQGEILRRMSHNDENELAHMETQAGTEFRKCEEFVARLDLDMELVDLEHIFGGERIIIYYLAEQRVDFRELVRQLAKEFQTRIEMRQIGVRDEAKLLADYGDCGKPVCCNTHLSVMPPVSMKMAKIQKATLDPTKISGRCGRLKCCLRYEYDTYTGMQKELPTVGSLIVTNNGQAKVLGQEILANQLLIETEDHRRMLIDAADVLSVIRQGSGGDKPRGKQRSRDRRESGKGPPHDAPPAPNNPPQPPADAGSKSTDADSAAKENNDGPQNQSDENG